MAYLITKRKNKSIFQLEEEDTYMDASRHAVWIRLDKTFATALTDNQLKKLMKYKGKINIKMIRYVKRAK